MQDLHVFDPTILAWTDLTAAARGAPPAARYCHGFSADGGRLYVFGGMELNGSECIALSKRNHILSIP